MNAYATQAACAVVLGALLVHFYNRYRKGYLLEWCVSWFALVVFHGAAAIDMFLLQNVQAARPLQWLALLLAVPAGLFQAFYFFGGAYQLAHLRPIRGDSARRAKVALISIGVGIAIVAAMVTEIRSHYLIVAATQGLALVVALATGSLLVQRRRATTTFALLLMISLAYSALKFAAVVLALLWMSRSDLNPYPVLFGLVELLLQLGLGLAMIISLLEDEREAAALAASQVEHLAYHDGLTGLPNRALFFDRLIVALSYAQRHDSRIALLFLDLDHFKNINDSLGHSAGDTILRLVAMRIREVVRREDTVARFGGDEFTVLLYNVDPPEDASRTAQKLLDVLKVPVAVGNREIVVSASIGISMYPGDSIDAESVVKNADTAMNRAKERGRDGYQLFAPEMNARVLEKLDLESSLRSALRDKQFTIFYQPLFDVDRGRIYGVEALLRWRHPKLGLLLPLKFIPAAEASGLIVPIGEWVLREACKQVKRWDAERGVELIASVNISPRQFQHTGLLESIKSALEEAELEPHRLEIEITESIAVQNVDHTRELLQMLKKLGIRIAIDDFGTGYSSLSYLKDFPVDTLKLDRSFVQDIMRPQDGAIARTVISMAHSLDMKVMAEGVENEAQMNFLKQNHCDGLQGFFYSVPLSSEAISNFFDDNEWLLKGRE